VQATCLHDPALCGVRRGVRREREQLRERCQHLSGQRQHFTSSEMRDVGRETHFTSSEMRDVGREIHCTSSEMRDVGREMHCTSSEMRDVGREMHCTSSEMRDVGREMHFTSSEMRDVGSETHFCFPQPHPTCGLAQREHAAISGTFVASPGARAPGGGAREGGSECRC
jgi:hypothetical protein